MSDPGNGGVILTIPDSPINVANVPSSTTATQIGLVWADGLENGGSDIIDYRVQYDQGTSNFINLESNILTRNYDAKSLQVGVTYRFRIQARSIFGYSLSSQVVSILAAQIPDQPVAPITIFNRDFVKIDWLAPFAQGSPITSYKIYVRESDSVSFSLELI